MSDDSSKASATQGFVVGALVVGTIAAGFFLSRQPDPAPPAPTVPVAAPSFAPAAPPAAPASPRQAADALFNEAMMAHEQNDQATLASVLPGAMAAYRALGELDDDGAYHLALLELAGGKLTEARATCATVLAKNPNHLLALGVSLRVAASANDAAAARELGRRLLKAYDGEVARPLPEYQDHERMFPIYRAEAMAAVQP
jgi:hypothetical protein